MTRTFGDIMRTEEMLKSPRSKFERRHVAKSLGALIEIPSCLKEISVNSSAGIV
ncbi:MAG: hypothetical protein H6925_03265 [Holosporaceae bacterium]|nr:MAG: hypothetical protein H6925_03265 [Holosporaceae bacterium]